jgi:hypothetical protein
MILTAGIAVPPLESSDTDVYLIAITPTATEAHAHIKIKP